MWPLGRYEFGTHGGGGPTLRAKGGQAFVVDVHALAGHCCKWGGIVTAGGRENWRGRGRGFRRCAIR